MYTITTKERTFTHPDYPGLIVMYRPLTNTEFIEYLRVKTKKTRERLKPEVELDNEEFVKLLEAGRIRKFTDVEVDSLIGNYNELVKRFELIEHDNFVGIEEVKSIAPSIKSIKGIVDEYGNDIDVMTFFEHFDIKIRSMLYADIMNNSTITKVQEKNSVEQSTSLQPTKEEILNQTAQDVPLQDVSNVTVNEQETKITT